MISLGYQRPRDGQQAVHYEILVSSLGGAPEHDGCWPLQLLAHVTPHTPTEILETEYLVRVRAHEWVPDLAGAGSAVLIRAGTLGRVA